MCAEDGAASRQAVGVSQNFERQGSNLPTAGVNLSTLEYGNESNERGASLPQKFFAGAGGRFSTLRGLRDPPSE